MRSRSLSRWFRFLRAITGDRRSRQPRPIHFRPIIESLELREVPTAITWIGGAFTNICQGTHSGDQFAWSNALNWQPHQVPGPADTAVFPDDFTITTCNNNPVTAPVTRFPVVDVPVTVAGIHAGPGDLRSLTVNQNLILTGASEWDSGSISVAAAAAFTNTRTGTLRMANPGVITLNGTLTNQGTVQQAGGADLQLANGTVDNQAGGLYDVQTDHGITFSNSLPTIFHNAGTLRKSGGTGISSFITSFSNLGGTIDVQKGTLIPWNANGGVSTGGTFTVAQNATLRFSTSGEQNTFTGTYTGFGAGTILYGTDFSASAMNIGSGGATFNFPTGLFQWRNSNIEVASGATLTNVGFLTLVGTDLKFLGGTLNNTATIIQKDTGAFLIAGATVNNQQGALYDLQGDGAITTSNVSSGSFNNNGTVRKSAGTGTSFIAAAQGFHNLGTTATIDVKTGTLIPWDGTNDSATGDTFTVAAGAVLQLGNATWTGTFTGSGAGTVLFNRGFVTIGSGGATFNFPAGLLQVTGGTLLTGSNGLTNTGAIGIGSSSTIDVSGSTLTNAASGAITLTPAANAEALLRGNGSLINHGHIIHTTAGGLNLVAPATLNNAADGTYELRADGTLLTGAGRLTNAGLLTKTAGTSTSEIRSLFSNSGGGLDVETGTLRPGFATYTGGTFTVATGAILDWGASGAGGATITGSFAGSGGGTVLLAANGSINAGTDGANVNFPPGLFQWTGGTLGGGADGLTNAGSITLAGPNGKAISGAVRNQSTITDTGIDTLELGSGTLTNLPGALYDMQADAALHSSSGTFVNQGTFQKSGGSSTSAIDSFFSNPGTVLALSGTLNVDFETTEVSGSTLTGGTWELFSGATLKINNNVSLTTSNATVILDGLGVTFTNLANLNTLGAIGSLTVQDGGAFTTAGTFFTNSGTLAIDATSSFTISANLTNFDPTSGTLTGGTYVVAGTLQFPNANIITDAANLVLDGSGGLGLILDQNGNNGLANLADIADASVLTLQNGYVLTTGGDLINFGYLLLDATSQLNVSGNYTQDAAATLEIQLGGAGGPSGQLNVAGAANLNGTLTLTPVNGYVPTTGDSFAILTFATRNGSDFATPPVGFNESFDNVNGILTVVAQ